MTDAEADSNELIALFRAEWPKILATLIRSTGSVELAEDAVQEAFARALVARDRALLINPAAWITTVARRIAIDALRRDANLRKRLPLLLDSPDAQEVPEAGAAPADDDRLGLLFLVCTPNLAPETRLALALRFVCGISTEAIAEVLLVEHTAMSARLTRAKRQIERDGIRFSTPDDRELDARLGDVLSTVYLLYTTGYTAPTASSFELTVTALELARALRRLRPDDLETAGLLSLLLLTDARSATRLGAGGELVTLEDADRRRWDRARIQEGLDLAVIALPGGGRFALQAGIAGLHAEAPSWANTDWTTIGVLYDRLEELWPSPAVSLARIVARSYGPTGADRALEELTALEPQLTGAVGRQAIAVRADLLRRSGRPGEARALYQRALHLERHAPSRDFFGRRIAELDGPESDEPDDAAPIT